MAGRSGTAQCELQWQPMLAVAGANGPVTGLATAATGDLYAAGRFTVVGDTFAAGVARWDGQAWHALGAGVDGDARAIVVMPNGDLVAGGLFATAGGSPVANIARWDGVSWSPLGAGLDGYVLALHLLPNGDLIAGGTFVNSGSQPARRVARWDGTQWQQVGQGIGFGQVFAIESLPNGDLAVGGDFSIAGNGQFDALAIFDGATFQRPGLSVAGWLVTALRLLPNGDLAFGGRLMGFGGSDNCGVWDGASLQALTLPMTGTVNALLVDASGQWTVGGGGAGVGTLGNTVLRGVPGAWNVVDESRNKVLSLAVHGGQLVAGSGRSGTTTESDSTVRAYDGVEWTSLGGSEIVFPQVVRGDGRGGVFVGGVFDAIGGVIARNIAHYHDGSWSPLGVGGDGPNGLVDKLALGPNGDLIVGGNFDTVGGAPAANIARWNGTSWSTLGAGLVWPAQDLEVGIAGEVYALAGSRVLMFQGGVWTDLTASAGPVTPRDICVLPDGDVVATGVISLSGPSTWRWDGSTWTALGSSVVIGYSVVADASGTIFVGGITSGGMGVSRWDGATWQPVGNTQLTQLDVLPNGDLIAFGNTAALATAGRVERWHGSTWTPVDVGVSGQLAGAVAIRGLDATNLGELYVAGNFSRAGSVVSAGIARAASTCPAASAVLGSGCSGAGGALSLAALDLPWIGATFHSRCTGLAPTSLALHAIGTTPLLVPLPVGAPGCTLFVQPDVVGVLFPAAGRVDAPLAVPASTSLVGLVARTQVIGLELDASLTLTRVTSSNALELTIGAL